MHQAVALGWDRPLGQGGSGGWNWWALAGLITLLALLLPARRSVPLPLVIALAALGGLILGDLTDAWGVTPVWGILLLVALSRNLLRRRRRHQV